MNLAMLVVALLTMLIFLPETHGMHHGCNATLEDPGVWECDFQAWPRLPFQMWWQNLSDFTSPIKKLRIYDIDLYISSRMFQNLSSYTPVDGSRNLSSFLQSGAAATGISSAFSQFPLTSVFLDPMSEPELELECRNTERGYLALYNDSFVGLEWIKRITIINCRLAGFDKGAFKVFTSLTSFRMLGGIWNDMAIPALEGLTLAATDIPGSGLVEITSLFPLNFLYFYMIDPLAGATTLTIRGNNMNRVQTSLVTQFTNVGRLDLSHNEYYYIPESAFNGLNRLASVDLYGIKWFCYCSGTWIFDWQETNKVELNGEFICHYPNSYKGSKLYDYRYAQCNSTKYYGVQMGNTFVEATDLILISGMFLTLLFSVIAIAMAAKLIKSRAVAITTVGGRRKNPNVQIKGRKQGWKA